MRNKAVFIALGVQADGTKDILGHRTREQRRGQVLAARHERVEEPGRQRRSDRRRRRIEGLSRSDQRRLSADHRSNLHRASHPPFDGFRLLERPQSPRRRIEGDLSSQRRRRGQVSAGGFRREPLGPKNIRRSRRAGDAIGSASFRSSPFRRPSGGSSTRRTPSRRSTPNYAAPCDPCGEILARLLDRAPVAKWGNRYPKLVGWAEETIEETLTFYRLPRQHHKHLKSTNMLERLNEEITAGSTLSASSRMPRPACVSSAH